MILSCCLPFVSFVLVSNTCFLKLSTNYFSLSVVVCIAFMLRLRRHSIYPARARIVARKGTQCRGIPYPFESPAIAITRVVFSLLTVSYTANWPLRITFSSSSPSSYEQEYPHRTAVFLPRSTGYQPYAYSRTTCSSYRATGFQTPYLRYEYVRRHVLTGRHRYLAGLDR